MKLRVSLLAALSPFVPVHAALAETIEAGPADDVEALINGLAPGDELVLAGGTYALDGRFGVTLAGTAAMPITIRAKDGETPKFLRADASQNNVDLDDVSYVTFRGIDFDGGSIGLRIVKARFLTIEACEVHNTDDVAIGANSGGPYEAVSLLRNHVHDTSGTGEGMYLGCNENACQFFDGKIIGNYIHHTNGPNIVQGDGIEIKEGSYNNIVADNVIHDTNYPCIITYSTAGNGPPNIIERNALWGCGDHGIQSAADAIIRNNIILGSVADGIAMQPHQSGAPSNLVVIHNTIVQPNNAGIRVSGAVGSVVIANNAVYAQSGAAIFGGGDLGQITVVGNVGVGGLQGFTSGLVAGDLAADFVMASFAGAPPMNVFPKAGSRLISLGDFAHQVSDDFNGTPRDPRANPDAGAYVFVGTGNPGWTLGPGFKGSLLNEGGSGGGSSAGGSGNGSGGSGASANGTGGGDVEAYEGDGCSCRAAGADDEAGIGWVALFVAVGGHVSRRRTTRASTK